MSFDYATLAATATRLLATYGRDMALRRVTGATFNAVTGAVSGGSPADLTLKGLFVQQDTAYDADASSANGDRLVIVDASRVPVISDKLIVGFVAYEIVNVAAIDPAGTALAYRLRVRS